MALLNSIPADAGDRLESWLAARLPDATNVSITNVEVPQSTGLSMTTMLVDASWTADGSHYAESLVARVAPNGPGVFMDPDLERENGVLTALADSAVPAPRARWFEDDSSVLGSPFLVMDRVTGRVPADDPPFTAEGWVIDLAPADRALLLDNGLQAMVAVHQVDATLPGLSVLDRPDHGQPGLEQQIGYWRQVHEWAAAGRQFPVIDGAWDWVDANLPTEDPAALALCWGDPRVGNVLFDEDLGVTAVLDWEMAAIADPIMDLGWWLFIQRHHTEGVGVPLPEGMPDRAQTIERYEQLTGRDCSNVSFYEAFAALRLSILMVRAGTLMIEAGAIPADNPMPANNPASQILAELTAQPAPDGTTSTFLGQRGG